MNVELQARPQRWFWKTQEIAVIRSLYPEGGAEACLPFLPGRTMSGVYQQARVHRVQAPRKRGGGSRKRWSSSEPMDAAIRYALQQPPYRNMINELARKLMRPRWWVSKRACALGLTLPRFKELPWNTEEIELLGEHSHKSLAHIRRLLQKSGHRRTETSIAVKRKRMRFDTQDPDYYTATSLAGLLGVDAKTVTRWIERDGLPATRRGTARTAQQGGDMHWIARRSLRAWMAKNWSAIDLRKVDRQWFMEMAFGGT